MTISDYKFGRRIRGKVVAGLRTKHGFMACSADAAGVLVTLRDLE